MTYLRSGDRSSSSWGRYSLEETEYCCRVALGTESCCRTGVLRVCVGRGIGDDRAQIPEVGRTQLSVLSTWGNDAQG